MRRQDLLDQRRARARHPDDEDWVGRFGAALARREGLCGECLNTALDGPTDLVRPVRLELQPQRVGRGIMREGLIRAPKVVQCLAEREVEVKAVLVGEVARMKRLLHRAKVGFGELHRLEVRKAPPCLAKRRLERDRLPVCGHPVGLPAYRL